MRWLFGLILALLLTAWYLPKENRKHLHLWEYLYLMAVNVLVFTPLSITDFWISITPLGTGRVSFGVYLWQFSVLENIWLTIPLGAMIAKHRPAWSLIISGLVVGGGIETIQYLISHWWWLNRSSDINDVIANAIGVMIGGVVWKVGSKLKGSLTTVMKGN